VYLKEGEGGGREGTGEEGYGKGMGRAVALPEGGGGSFPPMGVRKDR